jgi:hypothetical protein
MRTSWLHLLQKEQYDTLRIVTCQDLPRPYLFIVQNHMITEVILRGHHLLREGFHVQDFVNNVSILTAAIIQKAQMCRACLEIEFGNSMIRITQIGEYSSALLHYPDSISCNFLSTFSLHLHLFYSLTRI